ncbi:hypothetical protein [Parabacteroides goldsteinii]|uniref:hypothetical protein n=1 Tax=Parabacteroides goldsteinii TaxID=328812 RepID=UPI00259B6060|nr:hypothetical protein [Parabacteroides goldsteinii]
MAKVHPYKGYLNTEFRFYANGSEDISYLIISEGSECGIPVLSGVLIPNIPHSIKLNAPGKYKVVFNDGSSSHIIVEDGYKFGGGRFKKAFIFDNCQWVFIIMHDRTYFYNRETKQSYIEAISPDSISEISEEYIILSNNSQSEKTIYSVNDQKPILNISNLIFHNENSIIWKEEEEVIIFSLKDRTIVKRFAPTQYFIENGQILYSFENLIYLIDLKGEFPENELPKQTYAFCAFIDSKLSVFSSNKNEKIELLIINHITGELIKALTLDGHIASINGHKIINVEERKLAFRNFNLKQSDFPEASFSACYHDFVFFSCEWDIYYIEQTTSFLKKPFRFDLSEVITLKSINTDLNQDWGQLEDNTSIITDNRFLLFNNDESFVRSKFYSAAGYNSEGKVRVHKGIIILEGKKCVYTLSRNGFWDNRIERDYKYDKFSLYGIVYDNEKEEYCLFRYNIKGKELITSNNPTQHYELGGTAILPSGKIYFKKSELPSFTNRPTAVSPNLMLGIDVDRSLGKIFIITLQSGKEEKEEILKGVFDNSSYESVLLSQDGSHILYRNSRKAEMKDVNTGETISFDNLSFVEQSNGIRPTFTHSASLKPRVVNPITGQLLDAELLKKFHFISPNGDFYASTMKDMYIEHFFIESGAVIAEDEYKKLEKLFTYPSKDKKSTSDWDIVMSRRIKFVKDNFIHINSHYPKLTHRSDDEKKWEDFLIDKEDEHGVQIFLSRVFDIRGIAVIKKVSDDSIVAKIDLGKPLSYINYVSFSYDSRYLSLAGYRDFTHGLFLIYDLEEKKTLCRMTTNRAVWTTAFSSKESVAAYTSNPNTIFMGDRYECSSEKEFSNLLIHHRNFLTFSPDGSLMALSNQGYISKYDVNHEERSNWGHQPSTFVEIRCTSKITEENVVFRDLSDCGIADSCKAQSVASVSFSNDNKKLMMVGRDGVVIVRNLHLKEYAAE